MSEQRAQSATSSFELVASGSPAGASPLLDIWRPVGALRADADEPAYGTARAYSPPLADEIPRWRIDFLAGADEAAADIAHHERTLAAARRGVEDANSRLAAFVYSGHAGAREADVSFDAESLPAAEQDLRRLLYTSSGGSADISFGGLEQLGPWRSALQQFHAFVAQTSQVTSHHAWVETRLSGALLAHTVVSWTGQTASAWQEHPPAAHVALHRRALLLAIHSRDTLIRLMLAVVAGATRLASALTTPLAPVQAPLAACRFVQSVLEEWQRYPRSPREIGTTS